MSPHVPGTPRPLLQLGAALTLTVYLFSCGGSTGAGREVTGGRGSGNSGGQTAAGGTSVAASGGQPGSGGTGGGMAPGGSGGNPGSGGSAGSARSSGGAPVMGSGGAAAAGGRGGTGSGGRVGATGGAGGSLGPVGATVTVDVGNRFQTMEGFGGALAFFVNFLSEHPNRAEIYDLIFRDLGLDILRVGNWYQSQTVDEPTVAVVAAATASLGHPPRLLMSSWSPPAALKSNADTKNGGTLARVNGAYAYDQFGQWWASALQAYGARGVRPDFISIQNEPDFKATWETCLFGPIEGVDSANGGIAVAGYDKALEAVYARVQTIVPIPGLVAPEVAGLMNMKFQSYYSQLNAAHVGAIGHHLYNGGTSTAPDTFNAALQGVVTASPGKPRFMTEFAPTPPDMFSTAWLINNALTTENVNAYIYWDLIWEPPGGLVSTESPFARTSWTTAKGYIIRDPYYAVKHFARWVDRGWVRVAAASSATAVRTSAFVSPDGRQLTVVVLNMGGTTLNIALNTGTATFPTSDVFRTAGATDRTRDMGPLAAGGVLQLPSRGIATVTFAQ